MLGGSAKDCQSRYDLLGAGLVSSLLVISDTQPCQEWIRSVRFTREEGENCQEWIRSVRFTREEGEKEGEKERGGEKNAAYVLAARLCDFFQLVKHDPDRQRFALEQRLLPRPRIERDLAQIANLFVLGLDLGERAAARFADRFHKERFADAEFDRFVFGRELVGVVVRDSKKGKPI